MSILDQLGSIISQYSSPSSPSPEQASEHLQQVATQVPPSRLGSMLTNIFQSSETGSFGDNISHMYGQSNPDQQAGILNKLLGAAGPAVLSRLGLNLPGSGGSVTAEQAQQVSPQEVKQVANAAQEQSPGIVEEAGAFYSQHPQLVQALGAGVALWAMQRFQHQ